jgi:hypothetical protein
MAEQMRALGVALVDWVVHDVEPPPSAYPTLAGGDLAANTAEAMGYPAIPGFPGPTEMAVGLADYDFGPDLNYNDFSGRLSNQPPGIVQIIPALMPRVDEDGNERAGVPSLLHEAPLGTYTGWNVAAEGFFQGQPAGGGLIGGYIPFAATRREREALGDPRLFFGGARKRTSKGSRGPALRIGSSGQPQRHRIMRYEREAPGLTGSLGRTPQTTSASGAIS